MRKDLFECLLVSNTMKRIQLWFHPIWINVVFLQHIITFDLYITEKIYVQSQITHRFFPNFLFANSEVTVTSDTGSLCYGKTIYEFMRALRHFFECIIYRTTLLQDREVASFYVWSESINLAKVDPDIEKRVSCLEFHMERLYIEYNCIWLRLFTYVCNQSMLSMPYVGSLWPMLSI